MFYNRFIILLFLLLLFSKVEAQTIISPSLTGVTRPTLQNALDEFNYYHSNYNYLSDTETEIESMFGISVDWSESLLCWEMNDPETILSFNHMFVSFTANAVASYAKVARIETNSSRVSAYETKAEQGAEFLLWLEDYTGYDGVLPDIITSNSELSAYNSGPAMVAFAECYKTFGDQKYLDAAIRFADALLTHSTYPHTWYFNSTKYYSNVNHHAFILSGLSSVYAITGNQDYLDLAIQIAEEIISWQDYEYIDDPWGDLPDGGWYHACYFADPLPDANSDPSPDEIEAWGWWTLNRRSGYHGLALGGLVDLLNTIYQHRLEGTTTERNSVSFQTFRENLISSTKKAINYMIDQQETNSTSGSRINGLIKECKDYQYINADGSWSTIYQSTYSGLDPILKSYKILRESEELTSTEDNNLLEFLNSFAEAHTARGDAGYERQWVWSVMYNLSTLIEFNNTMPIDNSLNLVNTSFEDDEIVWELWSWDSIRPEIVNNNARTGSKALRILDTSTNSGKWACMLVTVEPSTQYTLEAYAKVVSGSSAMCYRYYTENLTKISEQYVIVNQSANYQKVTLTRTTPSNTKYLAVWFHAPWYGTSDTYWDDVTLVQGLPKNNSLNTSEDNLIENYSIENYPNPFNPSTNIKYQIKEQGLVTIKVYDILGKEITTLVNEIKPSGNFEVVFDAGHLASGMYVYTMKVNDFSISKKMFLVK